MIKIVCDLFDIAQRLKGIDDKYILFYNRKRAKFELHREDYGRVGYQLTLPYDSLDARTLNFCLKTRVERREQLMKELDRENEMLEKLNLCQAKKTAEYKFEEYLEKC